MRLDAYDLSVFVNCPFDRRYLPLFHALVFAVHDCGFIARCALEELDAAETRLHKIFRIIESCRYGIHDLSRVQVAVGGLPRFNMPFEAGIFFACKRYGRGRQAGKRILILDSEPYRYQAVLSDIAGQDTREHANDPIKIIGCVRNWLKTTSSRNDIPGAEQIARRYMQFRRELPVILKGAKVSAAELRSWEYFIDYRQFVAAWLEANG